MAWGDTTLAVKKTWLKKPAWVGSQQKWQPRWKRSQAGGEQPWGRRQQKGSPSALPDGYRPKKDARYLGTVSSYFKWRGFGYITPHNDGELPTDEIFVHWRNIQTEDRYPRLYKGLTVEFGVMVWVEGSRWSRQRTLRAKHVTLPGGGQVNIQDDMDSQKTFVGGQHLRYTGNLKFYNPRDGFGWLTLDVGYALDQAVPQELKVEQQELNCGGRKPDLWLENLAVEFGIYKSRKGQYMAYNVTLPGGVPILQESLENRQFVSPQHYRGTIQWYSWKQHWGHIVPDSAASLPPRVLAKMAQMQEAARQKSGRDANEKLLYFRRRDCARECEPEAGMPVTFRLYIDDKGAGAADVSLAS